MRLTLKNLVSALAAAAIAQAAPVPASLNTLEARGAGDTGAHGSPYGALDMSKMFVKTAVNKANIESFIARYGKKIPPVSSEEANALSAALGTGGKKLELSPVGNAWTKERAAYLASARLLKDFVQNDVRRQKAFRALNKLTDDQVVKTAQGKPVDVGKLFKSSQKRKAVDPALLDQLDTHLSQKLKLSPSSSMNSGVTDGRTFSDASTSSSMSSDSKSTQSSNSNKRKGDFSTRMLDTTSTKLPDLQSIGDVSSKAADGFGGKSLDGATKLLKLFE